MHLSLKNVLCSSSTTIKLLFAEVLQDFLCSKDHMVIANELKYN